MLQGVPGVLGRDVALPGASRGFNPQIDGRLRLLLHETGPPWKLSINPNVEKRIGSYKLEANKYVRLKFIYSSTSRVKVGIVNKSRNKVALKEIKSNDIQKIKVPKKDTYSIYIQNNSGKKITVSGVIIIL